MIAEWTLVNGLTEGKEAVDEWKTRGELPGERNTQNRTHTGTQHREHQPAQGTLKQTDTGGRNTKKHQCFIINVSSSDTSIVFNTS